MPGRSGAEADGCWRGSEGGAKEGGANEERNGQTGAVLHRATLSRCAGEKRSTSGRVLERNEGGAKEEQRQRQTGLHLRLGGFQLGFGRNYKTAIVILKKNFHKNIFPT